MGQKKQKGGSIQRHRKRNPGGGKQYGNWPIEERPTRELKY